MSRDRHGGVTPRANRFATMPQLDSVQSGQTFSKVDSGVPGARRDLVYQLLSKTAYLHAYC